MNLRPHQEESRHWLASRRRAYLGDAPRVGKTPAAIRAAVDIDAQHIVVICPAVVVGNWRHEWARWGLASQTLEVLSYDALVRRSVQLTGFPSTPDLVILDEAHYCKNIQAKRTRAALRLARSANWAWLLSGTPMPNHPGELFAPLAGLWIDKLHALGVKNYTGWLNLTCNWKSVNVGRNTWVPKIFGAKNVPMLRDILSSIMLRRTFEEVSGTEPIWWSEQVLVPGPGGFVRTMEKWGDDLAAIVEQLQNGEEPRGDHVATMRRLIGIIKAPLAAALIAEELREDPTRKKFVVAYHHDVLDILETSLAEFAPLRIDGSTPKLERDRRVAQFQAHDGNRVLLGQHEAAGTGITLDRATEVDMVEMVWTPGGNTQVANRASSTEKGTVPVRVLSLANTIDEAVNTVLVRKEGMQDAVGL